MKIQPRTKAISTPASPPVAPLELQRQLSILPLPASKSFPDGRMLKFRLHSAVLPDDRDVSIHLPPQYTLEPDRRFPVFYLHDGQNLFDPETSYIPGRTWRAHTTADRLNEEGLIEPVILIGIDNTGVRRMAEYTPTEDYKMGGGEGSRYGRLLTEELKPWVDRTFRTRTDASSTGIGGSSLGGLISLYLALRHPDVFGRVAVISPSIWWDQRSILAEVRRLKTRLDLRIWLDMGTAEGARHLRDTDLLHRLLIGLGWRDGVDLSYRRIPDAVHSEDAWADRFDSIIFFLFPLTRAPEHR